MDLVPCAAGNILVSVTKSDYLHSYIPGLGVLIFTRWALYCFRLGIIWSIHNSGDKDSFDWPRQRLLALCWSLTNSNTSGQVVWLLTHRIVCSPQWVGPLSLSPIFPSPFSLVSRRRARQLIEANANREPKYNVFENTSIHGQRIAFVNKWSIRKWMVLFVN